MRVTLSDSRQLVATILEEIGKKADLQKLTSRDIETLESIIFSRNGMRKNLREMQEQIEDSVTKQKNPIPKTVDRHWTDGNLITRKRFFEILGRVTEPLTSQSDKKEEHSIN